MDYGFRHYSANMHVSPHRAKRHGRRFGYGQRMLPISSSPSFFTSFFLGSFDFFMDALDRLEVLDRFDAQL